ncbi:hypothetical protein C7974DRAFT_114040 [Boeremia exigua]|uniref:uncharacterized protein n=1 Tax=Boeremia exigua TaxID=749465 RepID=UPI001E8E4693|nr:uncharacterized protein C7974DRAFT_114040 [Boeremia exigua]KAH6642987.1 hypothetical protein C7974DRAFT_114040 [Boeremia exigua]
MQTHLQPTLAVSSHLVLVPSELQIVHPATSQSDKHPFGLHDLPDDLLILIFSLCNIETVLTLRLTCTSFSAVIQAFIKNIAPSSARATFPDCNSLFAPPPNGYSLHWLRNLIPAQLASLTLDKDKLRRHHYINSGFLYGIPSESACPEALYWRQRVANGWKVLRSFHLISVNVYASCDDESTRPNAFRKVSGGVRTSRIWQAVSCQYAGCTEHGIKHVFASKNRRDSHDSHSQEQKDPKDSIAEVRRKETQVLKRRLARVKNLSDQDLLDYIYVWRLLLHVFRPYSKPETTVYDFTRGWPSHSSIPRPSWPNIISDMAQGCSWLNWFVLHVGSDPFLTQWALSPNASHHPKHNHIRNTIWTAWNARSTHQIEMEREYVSKFEFALRKRCLSSERLKRLEAEISRGRTINTISLDCIPWIYDQHHRIPRPPTDFPWYETEKPVWLDGEWGVTCSPGTSWSQPGVLRGDICRHRESVRDGDLDPDNTDPLAKVPYLVYLGTEEAVKLWPGSDGDGTELAF